MSDTTSGIVLTLSLLAILTMITAFTIDATSQVVRKNDRDCIRMFSELQTPEQQRTFFEIHAHCDELYNGSRIYK